MGIEKARMFLLGSPQFTVFVDHAPLIRVLGDKFLSDIENTRLLNLKEKTLGCDFNIKYIKGLKNHADVFSRYPVNHPDDEDINASKTLNALTINVIAATTESALSITLEMLKDECISDDQYKKHKNYKQNICRKLYT